MNEDSLSLSSPIEDLKLIARNGTANIYRSLREHNIATIGDLVTKSRLDLIRLPYIGVTTAMNIEKRLTESGLSLRAD
jgi:DNA-directed RNA polymerase alpha subunit